jgi:HEAT repeat protein
MSGDDTMTVTRWTHDLDSADVVERAAAARALGAFPDVPEVCKLLIGALRDSAERVREAATTALEVVVAARPTTVSTLVEAQRAARDTSRGWALERLLARIGTLEAVDPLFEIPATGSAEETALLEAIAASKALRTEDLVAGLQAAPKSRKRAIAEVLARRGVEAGYHVLFGERYAKSLVDRILTHGADGIRMLGRIFIDSDFDRYRIAVDDVAARRAAAESALHDVLGDKEWQTYSFAMSVLSRWDDPRTIDVLLKIASDPTREPEVREEAVEALCVLEAPEAVDVISAALLDVERESMGRIACASALGLIGNAAALAALEVAAQKITEEPVARHVRKAIESFVR